MKVNRANRHSRMRWSYGDSVVFLLTVLLICAAFGCSGMGSKGTGTPGQGLWPSPAQPQPGSSTLTPGLAVRYHKKKVRFISQMPTIDAMEKIGYTGKPIPRLAHRFGKGVVFGSGLNLGVCIQMTGFLNFPEPGVYKIKVNSNDGIQIKLDGETIISDPDVHSDRFSAPAELDISRPGWYPVLVRYFQRKGTATLELYWQRPGAGDYEFIPAEAYAHVPSP